MFKELVYELTRGLAYRRISHSEMRRYTVQLPLALYIIMIAVYFILPARPVWLGKDGLVPGLLAILSTLPGFYFAGLAAVSTFGSPGMDNEMIAPAPKVKLFVQGKWVDSSLTKRQFLSYLFSYLVIISFVLCFGLLALSALDGTIAIWKSNVVALPIGNWVWRAVSFVVGSGFVLIFASMVVTTLHGIFFLTERMHQP